MITHLLFDLDNTLYSCRYGLGDRVYERLIGFIAGLLGVTPEEAAAQRRERIALYGTTLEWLRAEKGLADPETYFRAVHPDDEAEGLPFDPALRPFLEGLSRPLAILTNSPMEPADRILDKLQIRDLFTHVFDIKSNGLKGKPNPLAFCRALDAIGSAPENTLFVDDYPRYIQGFLALGGRGLLIDERDNFPDFPGNRIRRLEELKAYLD
jgi:putative hydrolase of the HAD superfamily